jgi:hypothetical protein
MSLSLDDDKKRGRRVKRKKAPQSIRSYLSFGTLSIAGLCCFLVFYLLTIVCTLPMLHVTPSSIPMGPLEGVNLPRLPEKSRERLRVAASNVRNQLSKLRKGLGVSDEALLAEAKAEFEIKKAKRSQEKVESMKDVKQESVKMEIKTPGVIVLGMHRSGTSMLSGLLVNGIGYNVGGPLIGAAFDNAKGFFERIDVVLQNDEFLKSQRIWWASGVREYDGEKAYEDFKSGKIPFQEGAKGLDFLNNPANAPWLQKDPRMCITLKTWLHLLQQEPAIVFTYRHPLEVAMSLKKREQNFSLEHGLRLWVIYNWKAIVNSAGLCRVLSSNDKILANPLVEVQRIADELTSKCHMPNGPSRINQSQVDKFIDPELQHNKKELQKKDTDVRILEEHQGCKVKDYLSDLLDGSQEKMMELNMYKTAMKIYCDLESGNAYLPNYAWPELH